MFLDIHFDALARQATQCVSRLVVKLGAVTLAVGTTLGAWGAAHADEIRWPTPYLTSSQFARDLIAPSKLPPPPLRPARDERGLDLANYDATKFFGHVRSAPLEIGIAAGAIAAVGVFDWKWGDTRYHWAHEGYFGKNTHNGGMDKLGHAWTTYVIAEMLAERMQANNDGLSGAHITAALLAFGIMAGVEVGDAYTKAYGFSREDLVADAVGAGLALLRGAFPKLRDVFDYRVGMNLGDAAHPVRSASGKRSVPSYNGQRYILAIKGSGFEALRNTPARYAELQFGYDTQGFHRVERAIGMKPKRNFYVGVGLNLAELMFAPGPVPNFSAYRDTELVWAAESALRYVQVPYTSISARTR